MDFQVPREMKAFHLPLKVSGETNMISFLVQVERDLERMLFRTFLPILEDCDSHLRMNIQNMQRF